VKNTSYTKVQGASINSAFSKTILAAIGLLGLYMLTINLVVYGNLIPIWLIVLSFVSLLALPLTLVHDEQEKCIYVYWGIPLNIVPTDKNKTLR